MCLVIYLIFPTVSTHRKKSATMIIIIIITYTEYHNLVGNILFNPHSNSMDTVIILIL